MRRIRPRWLAVAATVGLGALAVTAVPAVRHWREVPPPPPPPLRLALDGETAAGAGTDHPFGLALAPDGRRLVFPVSRDGRVTLTLHDLATGEVRALPAVEGAVMPFWSHDGRRVAYFAGGRLHVLDVANGDDEDVMAAPSPRGGAWLASGDMVLQPDATGGLVRFLGREGRTEPFTTLDAAAGEVAHEFPAAGADGRHIVFRVRGATSGDSALWWAPIDRPQERRRLLRSNGQGVEAQGRLIFADGTTLMAQHIDADGTLRGRPSVVATPVGSGPLGQLFVAVADKGPLIYGAPASPLRTLTWVTRDGTPAGDVGSPTDSWDVRISPRGARIADARVAVTQMDAQLATLDVWAYEGTRPLPLRLSAAIEADADAVWSPDGARLAWVRGRHTVIVRGARAMLPAEVVRRFDAPVRLWDWTGAAGAESWLVVGLTAAETRDDLWIVPARGNAEARPLIRSPFRETEAAVSPDGRWIAFASDESGRQEIYVDAFPVPRHRARLTLGGGSTPRWTRGGRDIVFRRGRAIHAVSVVPDGDTLRAAASERLFDTPGDVRSFDVTSDGSHILLNLPVAPEPPIVRAVAHWTSLVLDRSP